LLARGKNRILLLADPSPPKRRNRMSKPAVLLALSLALIGAGSAGAQTYPTRPITVVVPFPPGGPTDAVLRILGERMRVSLGEPLVVEYVSGAAGSLGVGRVARAAPDGYTVLIGHSSTNVIVPALYSVPFDVMKTWRRSRRCPAIRFCWSAEAQYRRTISRNWSTGSRRTRTKCRPARRAPILSRTSPASISRS
jgi:hypothetical protein